MKRERRTRIIRNVGVALVTVALAGAWQLAPAPHAVEMPAVDEGVVSVATLPSFANLIEQVKPAVVNISTSGPMPRSPEWGPGADTPWGGSVEEFLRRFFDRQSHAPVAPRSGPGRSMGSGFIVDPSGLIVTNDHVVAGARDILVTLDDGTRHEATLVGHDQETDLALLQVEAGRPLPYARFGDSSAVRGGDWVVAIGNPFGLGGSATAGIISARGRDIQSGPFDDFLQIDAPINRGNSGGPLFDTSGMVIGVNTAIYSPNGGNVGIGFAIPADQAASVVNQLRADGYVARGWLGVQVQDLDTDLAEGLGLDEPGGALVAEVVPDGPADRAGLQAGDVILRVDRQPINDVRQLVREVASYEPETTVTLDLWREASSQGLAVELGVHPDTEPAAAAAERSPSAATPTTLGVRLAPLTPASRERFAIEAETTGVLVAEVVSDGPAAAKGLRAGDVIVRVDGTPVDTPADVTAALGRVRDDDRSVAVLHTTRSGQSRFVALPLGRVGGRADPRPGPGLVS